MNTASRFFFQGEQFCAIVGGQLSCRGEKELVMIFALKKLAVQFFFELLHHARERGLGDHQGLGGFHQGALFRKGVQSLPQAKFNHVFSINQRPKV